MLIWSAGGAPPAAAGNATSVFAAIRFQFVTSLACAAAGAASAIAVSAAIAAGQIRLGLMTPPSALRWRVAARGTWAVRRAAIAAPTASIVAGGIAGHAEDGADMANACNKHRGHQQAGAGRIVRVHLLSRMSRSPWNFATAIL